jgi:ABC-2 type transport system permease protein
VRALVYLAVHRLLNALRRVPGSPRLLAPVLGGLLVLLLFTGMFLFLGSLQAGRPRPQFAPRELVEGGPGALVGAVKAFLLFSLLSSVIAACGEGSVFFTQSDVDFLFPAPLRRRAVLLFKMAGTYAGHLIPALYLPFMLGNTLALRSNITPLAYWPGSLGMFLFLLSATNLAQTMLLSRAQGEESATRRERIQRAARWALVLLLLLAGWAIWRAVEGAGEGARGLLRIVNSDLSAVLFFPLAWAGDLLRVAFEGWTAAAVGKLAGMIALAAGSLALLFARERDFYEGAMEVGTRRERMVSAVRRGDAGAIHAQMASEGRLLRGRTLRPLGGGAWAIVWKDLISMTRVPGQSWGPLAFIAALPALMGWALNRGGPSVGGEPSVGGGPSVVLWIALFTLQMSGVFLLSLRDMLRRADLTKALPISPTRLLLGEQCTGILLLTILGWLSLGVMAALGGGPGPLTIAAFWALPSLAALLLLVQTCFVLLYPNQDDPAQKSIGGLLSLIACTLALLPSFVAGALLSLLGSGPVLLGLGVSLVNLVVAGIALAVATLLWQRFDPTD